MDFAGPFLGKMFFILVDAHSKWPEVFLDESTTAQSTVDILRSLFASHGLPLQLVSDNSPQCVSAEFAEFLERNKVKHVRCAPYHPASNGLAERFVRTFKEAMKAGNATAKSVHKKLVNFLLRYQATPHPTTGRTPASLFLNRDLRTQLNLLKPDCEKQVFNSQSKNIDRNGHALTRELSVGQAVMARNYGSGEKWLPGIIIGRQGPVSYLVQTERGEWRRHIDQLRARIVLENSANQLPSDDCEIDVFYEPQTGNKSNGNLSTTYSGEQVIPAAVPRYNLRNRPPQPPNYLLNSIGHAHLFVYFSVIDFLS